jgi:hypothetical protein
MHALSQKATVPGSVVAVERGHNCNDRTGPCPSRRAPFLVTRRIVPKRICTLSAQCIRSQLAHRCVSCLHHIYISTSSTSTFAYHINNSSQHYYNILTREAQTLSPSAAFTARPYRKSPILSSSSSSLHIQTKINHNGFPIL